MALHSTYTDEQLVELLKDTNEGAFTEIYNRYVDKLYQFSWNILKDDAECRDAVQEVFIWLWKHRRELKVKVLKYYLLAAVKHKLIRAIHNSKRREEILAKYPQTEQFYEAHPLEIKELKHFIAQFIQTLPPRAKEVFRLSREQYLSNKEIADEMQISEKTVENHMTIVLKKLRRSLEQISFWLFFIIFSISFGGYLFFMSL